MHGRRAAEPLLSRKEVAAWLGCSVTTVRRMERDGALVTVRVRGLVRVARSEVARVASPRRRAR